MLQKIDDRDVYVVELTGFPKQNLPITWDTEEERPYAIALDSAIKAGLIDAPGKYGIEVTYERDQWIYNIYAIHE